MKVFLTVVFYGGQNIKGRDPLDASSHCLSYFDPPSPIDISRRTYQKKVKKY